MNTDKTARQRFALIIGEGRVRAVGEITGITIHADRVALDGKSLPVEHPVHDRSPNTSDLRVNRPQNSVGYCELQKTRSI